MKKSFFLPLVFLLASGFALAQDPIEDKAQLERERQAIQNEIKEIQGMYNKVKGQKKQTLGQLNLLQRKINLQNKYISNINKQLRFIDNDIYRSNVEVYRLQKQLDTLKVEYARSVVYAYKNRSTYDFLNFIFSAGSFNDAVKRISYLKSYRNYRQEQVSNILNTQKLIEQRKKEALGKRKSKDEALKNQTVQAKVLDEQKKEKDVVITKLKAREKDLSKQLDAKKKRDRQLKNAMDAIVRREIDEARKKAEAEAKANADKSTTTKPSGITTGPVKKTESKPKSYLDLNAKDVALNANFENNRGKLPWPVDNGVVSVHFGRNEYAITGNSRPVIMDNPGITIATPSSGTTVKAIFEGEVAGIGNIGDIKMVMIRHGKYFTAYSNLSSVSVSKGAIVKTGQTIGRAAADEDGNGGMIEFMLLMENKQLNPEPWLRR